MQESLSNVARHAEADVVNLNLNMTLDQVTLTIADNGRGFDSETVSATSQGLAGMRQRLVEVGGTLRVESLQSIGTRVTAEVKLQA